MSLLETLKKALMFTSILLGTLLALPNARQVSPTHRGLGLGSTAVGILGAVTGWLDAANAGRMLLELTPWLAESC